MFFYRHSRPYSFPGWLLSRQGIRVFKILFLIFLTLVFFRQVFGREDLSEMKNAFLRSLEPGRWAYLFMALFLVPVNWTLETLKWRQFTRSYSEMTFWASFQAVLMGVAFSLLTPNRIGDMGGRLLGEKARYAGRSVVASLMGNFCQWVVLVSGGIVGSIYFAGRYLGLHTLPVEFLPEIGLAMVFAFWIVVFSLSRLGLLLKKAEKIKIFQPVLQLHGAVKDYSKRAIGMGLFWAFFRYITYGCQYFLMLLFFGIPVPPMAAISGIATIFLIQTSLPLPPFLGLLARGEVALSIWGGVQASEIGILSSTFGLYIINLLLPSFFGAIILITTDMVKSLNYENPSA